MSSIRHSFLNESNRNNHHNGEDENLVQKLNEQIQKHTNTIVDQALTITELRNELKSRDSSTSNIVNNNSEELARIKSQHQLELDLERKNFIEYKTTMEAQVAQLKEEKESQITEMQQKAAEDKATIAEQKTTIHNLRKQLRPAKGTERRPHPKPRTIFMEPSADTQEDEVSDIFKDENPQSANEHNKSYRTAYDKKDLLAADKKIVPSADNQEDDVSAVYTGEYPQTVNEQNKSYRTAYDKEDVPVADKRIVPSVDNQEDDVSAVYTGDYPQTVNEQNKSYRSAYDKKEVRAALKRIVLSADNQEDEVSDMFKDKNQQVVNEQSKSYRNACDKKDSFAVYKRIKPCADNQEDEGSDIFKDENQQAANEQNKSYRNAYDKNQDDDVSTVYTNENAHAANEQNKSYRNAYDKKDLLAADKRMEPSADIQEDQLSDIFKDENPQVEDEPKSEKHVYVTPTGDVSCIITVDKNDQLPKFYETVQGYVDSIDMENADQTVENERRTNSRRIREYLANKEFAAEVSTDKTETELDAFGLPRTVNPELLQHTPDPSDKVPEMSYFSPPRDTVSKVQTARQQTPEQYQTVTELRNVRGIVSKVQTVRKPNPPEHFQPFRTQLRMIQAPHHPTLYRSTPAVRERIPFQPLPSHPSDELSGQQLPPKDEYMSSYYRATGKPGLSDLRRIGIEPQLNKNVAPQDYRYSSQEDWGGL